MDTNIRIADPSEGPYLSVAGSNYRILVDGAATQGAYAVIEMLVPPGGGPQPHAHANMQELFYLVEGAIEFKTEAGKKTVQAGGFVDIPFGGAVHCFKNTSNQLARMICTVTPAGLEQLFREIGTPVQVGQFLPPPEPTPELAAKLKSLAAKYEQTFYPPGYLD